MRDRSPPPGRRSEEVIELPEEATEVQDDDSRAAEQQQSRSLKERALAAIEIVTPGPLPGGGDAGGGGGGLPPGVADPPSLPDDGEEEEEDTGSRGDVADDDTADWDDIGSGGDDAEPDQIVQPPGGGGGGDDGDGDDDDDGGGGGGGGGGGIPDCPPGEYFSPAEGRCVEETEPPDDESHLALRDMDWRSPSVNTIEVDWTLENVIDSGDGEGITSTVAVNVDGEEEDRSTRYVGPGDEVSETVTVLGVDEGTHEVCIEDTQDDLSGFCQDVNVSGPPFQESAVFVTDCSGDEGVVGGMKEQEVTVQNNNQDDADITLTAFADGDPVGQVQSVAGGGASTHTVDYELPDDSGEYTFDITVTSASPV